MIWFDIFIIFLLIIVFGSCIVVFIFLRDMDKVLNEMSKRIEKMKEKLEERRDG